MESKRMLLSMVVLEPVLLTSKLDLLEVIKWPKLEAVSNKEFYNRKESEESLALTSKEARRTWVK
jgi:hypothetical protein